MNIHEYQGKDILKSFGVPIAEGIVAETPKQAVEAANELSKLTGTKLWVIKAQIHAGGRGKGTIIGSEQRGVALAKTIQDVETISGNILGKTLVTLQTGPAGKQVNKVLVAADVYFPGESPTKEYYMSVLLDRAKGRNIIMYSTEGGMNIEDVAHHTPHLIHKEEVDSKTGLLPFQARKIAFNLGLEGDAFKHMVKFVSALYKAYDAIDASLLEINPVLKTSDNRILAVDTKLSFDENALFRHKDYEALRDISEEDPTEVEAGEHNLNYVKLDGNVGCMVNGAGLAMATMDIIKLSGGEPANFLDVGGTANAQRVEQAFRIILKDPNVKAILVNIFGGIVRCDRVAQGIVEAYNNMGSIKVPIIVRLQGTNAVEAKKIIDESGLQVYSAIELQEAANLVKKLLS
jgi:succinyl-CoA synthetase beta subunit